MKKLIAAALIAGVSIPTVAAAQGYYARTKLNVTRTVPGSGSEVPGEGSGETKILTGRASSWVSNIDWLI